MLVLASSASLLNFPSILNVSMIIPASVLGSANPDVGSESAAMIYLFVMCVFLLIFIGSQTS